MVKTCKEKDPIKKKELGEKGSQRLDVVENVRKAICSAAANGEKLSRKVRQITTESVKNALGTGKPSSRKIQEVAADVAKGFAKAPVDTKLRIRDLVSHAIGGISTGVESFGNKAKELAATTAENTIDYIRSTMDKNQSEPIRSNIIKGKKSTMKKYKFKLKAEKGKKVYIAGSFNSWNPERHRLRYRDNVYGINLEIPIGRHEYRFVVSGEWRTDPLCEEVTPNEFGATNSVVIVRE